MGCITKWRELANNIEAFIHLVVAARRKPAEKGDWGYKSNFQKAKTAGLRLAATKKEDFTKVAIFYDAPDPMGPWKMQGKSLVFYENVELRWKLSDFYLTQAKINA